jgi:hypothetical protein
MTSYCRLLQDDTDLYQTFITQDGYSNHEKLLFKAQYKAFNKCGLYVTYSVNVSQEPVHIRFSWALWG